MRLRVDHPAMGGRKLHAMLDDFRQQANIKMGRDAFFDLLLERRLLVRRRATGVRTTNSFHWFKKYKNLIKDVTPTGINQLWVTDITYWKIETGHIYVSLITDAFSHKIVGYHLAESLHAIHSVQALQMAFRDCDAIMDKLIHHSDRGVQYCCDLYVKELLDRKVNISMTEDSVPTDNAIAERINGILKAEYLSFHKPSNFAEAKLILDRAIALYNNERPHLSIGMMTPESVHNQNLTTKKLWKNYPYKHPATVMPV